MSLFSLNNQKWHFKFYVVPQWKPCFVQINFLTLLCPSEFFPRNSAQTFGNKWITMKVQIADNSNLVTLVDKIYPRRNLSQIQSVETYMDSQWSMKYPVRCVFEDLFIWNADFVQFDWTEFIFIWKLEHRKCNRSWPPADHAVKTNFKYTKISVQKRIVIT